MAKGGDAPRAPSPSPSRSAEGASVTSRSSDAKRATQPRDTKPNTNRAANEAKTTSQSPDAKRTTQPRDTKPNTNRAANEAKTTSQSPDAKRTTQPRDTKPNTNRAANEAKTTSQSPDAKRTTQPRDTKPSDRGHGPGAEVWDEMKPMARGRAIEDALGKTDYKSYISTDKLTDVNDTSKTPFARARNFPEIDFMSDDGSHLVSVKTVDTRSESFRSGNWYDKGSKNTGSMAEGAVGHAQSLVDRVGAQDTKVTLDIRVRPDTPREISDGIRDNILNEVDDPHGRLNVIVRTYP